LKTSRLSGLVIRSKYLFLYLCSLSTRPEGFSGRGLKDLVSISIDSALTVNSPVVVRKSFPWIPTISPRTQVKKSSYGPPGRAYDLTYAGIRPYISCKVIKLAVPIMR
jgi:hypothetical protein